MAEMNNPRRRSPRLASPPRRQSSRLASPPQKTTTTTTTTEAAMARSSGAVKRSITVRKIAPRKTVVPSEHDKENQPRRSGSGVVQQKKQKISTPTLSTSSSAERTTKKKKAAMPSPILPPSSSSTSDPDPEDAVWSQKVRRSYSRLSDQSRDRDTLFGFEKLQTPEVMRATRPPLEDVEAALGPSSSSVLNSFASLLEAEESGSGLLVPVPDRDIPGVAVSVGKEKRRRKKVQQIGTNELDALAARMNAEFEEAEGFELVVE
ncbi:unnamed protein product [Ophioblennius macclurei]